MNSDQDFFTRFTHIAFEGRSYLNLLYLLLMMPLGIIYYFGDYWRLFIIKSYYYSHWDFYWIYFCIICSSDFRHSFGLCQCSAWIWTSVKTGKIPNTIDLFGKNERSIYWCKNLHRVGLYVHWTSVGDCLFYFCSHFFINFRFIYLKSDFLDSAGRNRSLSWW